MVPAIPAPSPPAAQSPNHSDIENDKSSARVNSPRRNTDNNRTLESVSSLRDTHSGSITEIKVWSQPTSPSRQDATSPPVEPVSSQSSTSEDSSNQRPKYTLAPSTNKRAQLKKTASGKEVLLETVSSLRDVASSSLSDLKEWAATHTRSDPIETVSSSVSSNSSSSMLLEKGKPPMTHQHDTRTTTAAATKEQQQHTPLLESVSSLKQVASETMTGIKQWAAKLPSSREDSHIMSSETKRLYSKQDGEAHDSPQRATRTLYGAQTGYETIQPSLSESNSAKKRVPCSAQLKMMQDLVSRFLACTNSAATNTVVPEDDEAEQVLFAPIKDRKGQPVVENDTHNTNTAWANWNPIIGALDNHRALDSFDDSILTYDSEAEEMEQIRRMTSWGTMGTATTNLTATTNMTLETARTLETSDGTMVEATIQQLVQDDEGNLIHPVLLEKAKRRRETRKKKGRKRMVKFDYPPISSLRECPRTDPEDLPNLFFTEEELDQIEDDRYDTKIADDVEIVAISSIKSCEDYENVDQVVRDMNDDANIDPPPSSKSSDLLSPCKSGASFSKYTSTPKLRSKNRRPSSPFPRRRSDPPKSSPGFGEKKGNTRPPTPETAPSSREQQRLLKGVQIFLRERSTGSR